MYENNIDLMSPEYQSLKDMYEKGSLRKTEVLSQNEIDQLLTAINAGEPETDDISLSGLRRKKQRKQADLSELEKLNPAIAQEVKNAVQEIENGFFDGVINELTAQITKVQKENNELKEAVNILSEKMKSLARSVQAAELFE